MRERKRSECFCFSSTEEGGGPSHSDLSVVCEEEDSRVARGIEGWQVFKLRFIDAYRDSLVIENHNILGSHIPGNSPFEVDYHALSV